MVQISGYKESEFIISSEIRTEQKEEEVKLGVNINPVLKYKDGIDVVGCQMKIVYTLKDKPVFHYSAIISVWIEGWKEFLEQKPADSDISAHSVEAWTEVLGFARGVIYSKAFAQGQAMIAEHLLPPIEMERFMAAVRVEKVEK